MRTGHKSLFGIGAALAAMQAAPMARIYGAENIRRHIQKHGRSRQIGHSIADQPHEHKREIARRKRQAERIDANRHERAVRASRPYGPYPAPNKGLTRSGREIDLQHYAGGPA